MKSFEEGGFRRGSIAPSQQISGRIRNKTGGGGTGSDMRLRSNSLSEHSPEKSKMRHPTAAPATSSNLQPLCGSEEVSLKFSSKLNLKRIGPSTTCTSAELPFMSKL